MTHTPTPWIFDSECRAIWAISQKDFDDIDELSASDDVPMICDDINEANAAHIVKCVNMHDQMLITIGKLASGMKRGDEGWSKLDEEVYQLAMEAPHA